MVELESLVFVLFVLHKILNCIVISELFRGVFICMPSTYAL